MICKHGIARRIIPLNNEIHCKPRSDNAAAHFATKLAFLPLLAILSLSFALYTVHFHRLSKHVGGAFLFLSCIRLCKAEKKEYLCLKSVFSCSARHHPMQTVHRRSGIRCTRWNDETIEIENPVRTWQISTRWQSHRRFCRPFGTVLGKQQEHNLPCFIVYLRNTNC